MKSGTVLVIEDNKKNMKLVRLLLELGNYRVVEAEDAEAGLKLAYEHPPDLVLMDIQLPGIDGLQATRTIRSDPLLKHIPVIALTSYAMEGDDKKAKKAGCQGYITKPIDTKRFLKQISPFFRKTASSDKAASPKNTPSHGPRVLIVDDDPSNVKLMSSMLSTEPYDIITAFDGTQALARVKAYHPDLILLDVMMPGIDGYEVTRRLKADSETKFIPIILVTSLDSSEDRKKAFEAGAEEFLTKPVNVIELLARIQSMLKLRRYQDQLNIRIASERSMHTCAEAPQFLAVDHDAPQHVLIVEDSEKDLKLLLELTRGQPYQVITAADGQKALNILQRTKVDLVLLDVMLPGINGFEICGQIKGSTDSHDIQVIMVTCLDDLENKIKGVEIGADDFLVKPINHRELLARVKVLLQKKTYLDQLHNHYEMALKSAITDGLTEVYNATYFRRTLALEIKRAIRQKHSTAVVMMDLDNFKQINDTFGHPFGDLALRQVAKIIKSRVRDIDVVARYGGEEFSVILPYTGKKEALGIAERIRQAVSSFRLPEAISSGSNKITVSSGVAVYPDDADGAEELVKKADYYLYQAKTSGKNRVAAGNIAVPERIANA